MSDPNAADPKPCTADEDGIPTRRRCAVPADPGPPVLGQPGPQIFVATFDSRHYTWTGFGMTRQQAVDALAAAWTSAGADPDQLYRDDINVLSGPPGTGFRDDRPLITT